MDSRTGEVYLESEITQLKPKTKKHLVEVDGRPEDIRRISKAVKKQNKRDLEKKIRKEARRSRKKNRQ